MCAAVHDIALPPASFEIDWVSLRRTCRLVSHASLVFKPLEMAQDTSRYSPVRDIDGQDRESHSSSEDQSCVAAACTACRSKHLKCDGSIPCARCRSRGSHCQYLKSQRGRNRNGKLKALLNDCGSSFLL